MVPEAQVTAPGLFSRRLITPALIAGAAITAVFVLAGLIALVWTPHDPAAIVITSRLQGMSATHWLGTDHFGRDIASMLLKGTHNSVIVALVAVGIGIGIGVPLGLLAAVRGGLVDAVIMRANDITFAFPAILSAVMITAIYGPGAVNAMIAIGIFNVPVFARLARGAAMVAWRREYVLAARALGRSRIAISVVHILPNIASVLIVQATIQFALAILAEAGLSYVGLGTRPPTPSWGRMLAEAQTMVFLAPQLVLYPGLTIAFAVLGLNLLGDGLRDALDPRLSRSLR